MDETYYHLLLDQSKDTFGAILRVREGQLEELTGFIKLQQTGETSAGKHYEADVNTNARGGDLIYMEGEHKPEIIGLTVGQHSRLEIHKQPRKRMRLETITMKRAAEILESIRYLRDAEAYMASG